MRYAIYGAGAIGGLLGARLAASGLPVALLARGAHLAAIQGNGLRVRSGPFGDFVAHPPAMDDPADVGEVDVVVLAVKATALREVAPRLAPLLGPQTAIITLQNGLPWWYFQGLPQPLGGMRLRSVDPGGVLASAFEQERIIGGIAYPSATVVEPGVIEHSEGDRFTLGEPSGEVTERIQAIASEWSAAGFRTPVRRDIRNEIWLKILGNAAVNPIGTLAHATVKQTMQHPAARALVESVMREVKAVGESAGVEFALTIERRMAGLDGVGHHKTSMLQDLELGRTGEVEAIVGAVIEVGEQTGVQCPHLKTLYACADLRFASQSGIGEN